jgi:hypothetical protein
MTEALKIFTVSLAGLKKYKAYAVWNGENLAITHVLPLKGAFGTWKASVIDEIQKKQAAGFTCIVEEKTDKIAQYASRFNLEDMDMESGRSNFYTALDWYFSLLETESLIMAKDYQSFVFRAGGEGQRVEKKQDEKGRVIYNINWEAFTPGHRCVLLCVVGAMIEPVSQRYLEQMLKGWLTPDGEKAGPLSSFHAITEGQTKARLEALAAAQKR